MARTARIVVEGMPHHVIQRGNRRQRVFFKEGDRLNYLKILKEQAELHGLRIWAYCLMDNHVHPGSGVKRRNFVLITFHLSTEFDYNMMQEIVLT